MNKPKQPTNYGFWLWVLSTPEGIEAFRQRGTDYQLVQLNKAQRYKKWENIRKEER